MSLKSFINNLFLILLSGLHLSLASASETPSEVTDLMDLSLRDLLDVEVTLSSRKKESEFRAAAAIYTITREDIRRSGLRRIPELLRMVPGIHVAKIDNNNWAISARNNPGRFSANMLVMMDGRILYNNLFAGVNWDVQNTYLDDIERIEVIRGPGAALWGANAVDGVINIVTRDASDTLGAEVYAGAGTGEFNYEAGFRHGAQLGEDTQARVYVKKLKTGTGKYMDVTKSTNNGFFPVGEDAYDEGDFKQIGFRSDTNIDVRSSLTLQGDIYQGDFSGDRVIVDFLGVFPDTAERNIVDASGYDLLLRWDRKLSEKSIFNLQFYVDHTERVDRIFDDERTIYDFDMQHHYSMDSQQIAWGLGVRRINDSTSMTNAGFLFLTPSSAADRIYSLFVQDRINFDESFSLTVGGKFEHNNYTEGEFQPTIRGQWNLSTETVLWGSVSRAVSTPSRVERDSNVVASSPATEILVATEFGFRHQFTIPASIDVSLFNNDYDKGANAREDAKGLEVTGNYLASEDWSLELNYAFHLAKDVDPATGMLVDNELIPENSINIRSLYAFNERWQFDSFIYYIDGGVIGSSGFSFPASTRIDLRLGWLPTKHWVTSLLLTNVTDDSPGLPLDQRTVNTINTDIPGSIYFQAKYLH